MEQDSRTAHPEAVARRAPLQTALQMADTGEALTYAQLTCSAHRIGRALAGLGLGVGATIACLMSNAPSLFQVVWAAKNNGWRYVMVGTRLNAADIDYIVRDSGATALICTADLASRIVDLRLEPEGIRMICADGTLPGFCDLRALAAIEPATTLPGRKRGASMLYSSGTTGRPKGVKAMLSDVPPEVPPPRHAGLLAAYGLDSNTVFITAAPLYHAAPLRISMAVQRAGGTVIVMRKFDAEAMLAAIERTGATHGFFVPTMFQRMLDLPDAVRAQYCVTSMRHAIHGAAPCPVAVKRGMIDWWGLVIDELYGGTESIGQTFINAQEWLAHPGSVGRPPPHVQVKIVDAQGRILPAGETGLIRMRNTQRFAYHGAAASPGAEDYDAEGYASLGDIGYLDADGYLYLTDRSSNMIITGGVNVYPREAEDVLHSHPAIADVAVVGTPDRDLGEVVTALIVLKQGYSSDRAMQTGLLDFCVARLSQYKCPRSIIFVSDLPRNEMGKLMKCRV
ncbi:AMP-binding protein [Novosphingobium sp. 9U]|uniref:AMP-binding protein n=1 Tax=Novosphingobium sp. 9U TaxID=2653158 RepID=UPI0012F3C261|nr:AMP-binding protein [Novosphingobium sp. 9U]VWX50220.1 Acyl-CoA synthetase (AMP-forming)/AMP-acid ligase II [Novosphingobium sp. 9U]